MPKCALVTRRRARSDMVTYVAVHATLYTPPSAVLSNALAVQAVLASIPEHVRHGKAQVTAVHADTTYQLDLLELGFFGDDLAGYTSHILAERPEIDTWRLALSTITFVLPVLLSGLAVVACVLRRGELALHAGQGLLVLLPWVVLLGISVELPASVILRDGCDQLEDFIYWLLGDLGEESAALARSREPVYGYMTGCVREDPMADFFQPIALATRASVDNVTDVLAHLTLRPGMSASVNSLRTEMASISSALATVRTVMSCGNVYDIFTRAKTAVCCDLAHATNFLWISRVLTAVFMLPAAVGAIAGYKRFRRKLWGPYASVQALEVGAYL